MADWITTDEAARLTAYGLYHIRRLIKTGKVKAQLFGRTWQVSRASLMAYHRIVEKKGKKRGPKQGT